MVETVRSNDNPNVGYNASTDKYEDLIAAGVIDPTKVTPPPLDLLLATCSARVCVPAQWNAPQRSLLFLENKSRIELLAFAIRSCGGRGHRFTIVRDHDATRGMIPPTCLIAYVG